MVRTLGSTQLSRFLPARHPSLRLRPDEAEGMPGRTGVLRAGCSVREAPRSAARPQPRRQMLASGRDRTWQLFARLHAIGIKLKTITKCHWRCL